MNTSASVMNTIPFAGSLGMALVAFVVAGMIVVAVLVVRETLKNRRAAYLEAMEANPELEAFGFPIAKSSRKRDMSVDTGSILKSEGYSV